MFYLNWRYNRPIVSPIIALIVDQTCTFQCVIPMGDLSKIRSPLVMNRLVAMDEALPRTSSSVCPIHHP